MTQSLAALLDPEASPDEDDRSGDEIAAEVLKRAGLEVVKG